jgi:signal transduction histidine kinase
LSAGAGDRSEAAGVTTGGGKMSIAGRLFLSASILSFAILLLAGVVLSHVYQRAAEADFDERLGVYLRALVADIATPSENATMNPDEFSDPQFALALSGWYWQITRIDTEKPVIRSSRSLFAALLPRLADSGVPAGMGGARRGYAIGPDRRRLRILERVIDTGDNGIYLMQVAGATDDIEAAIGRFDLYVIVTFVLLAMALIVSSAAQLRYGLAPLRQLQEGVAAIRRGESETITGALSPDLAPLAGELNLLIGANRAVVERARTQVGNLAHALKTPLSVLINEAALEPGPLSGKVQEQAAIMRDQVAYYLDRARAAVRAGAVANATDVGPVVQSLAGAFRKIYAERAISFGLNMPRPVRFLGERQDLEEMIGNLVDNAGKWASSAVEIRVAPDSAPSETGRSFFDICIEDDGPGLAPERRAEALARGRRLDETKPGSGLGLSIVAELASLYGGDLTLDAARMGGLRAGLRLPAAATATPETRS